MVFHRTLLLAGAAFLTASAAHADIVSRVVAQDTVDAPPLIDCTIEEIFKKQADEARKEGEALAQKKDQELVDPENRADRGAKRTAQGDNTSLEGGMARHRLSFDRPVVTVKTKRISFDIPETIMTTRTEIRANWCMVNAGLFKTKVPCNVSVQVPHPEIRMRTVVIDVPDGVDVRMESLDLSYDTPSMTSRDNEKELKTAKGNIDRIKNELKAGRVAIADRHQNDFVQEANAAIDAYGTVSLLAIDRDLDNALAGLNAVRNDLETRQAEARAEAGPHAGEVDAAMAPAFQELDNQETATKAAADVARQNVRNEANTLRDDVNRARLEAAACHAKI